MSLPGRIVSVQVILGFFCSLALLWAVGWNASKSALLATGCVALPSAYYAWMQAHTYNATRILAHGVLRMMLTATLMALCVLVVGIEPVGFFVTFAVVHLAYILAGLFSQGS
ncbi:MAG: hypothetical protein GXP16_11910 [Gammaproteobacteria bacterium]|nr:hypothetical protein [Gammaproteobacteria bacterium]